MALDFKLCEPYDKQILERNFNETGDIRPLISTGQNLSLGSVVEYIQLAKWNPAEVDREYSRVLSLLTHEATQAQEKLSAATETKQAASGDNAGGKVLKPIYEKAYQSYCMAIDKNPDFTDKQDKDIYDWLNREHDEVLPDYELPAFETWQRYLREGRKHYSTSKNTPRAGRTGRSIITLQ